MKKLSCETEKSFEYLKNYLSSCGYAAVAYSGGVDSTLLLYAASIVPGLKVTAYTVNNVMISADETAEASDTAKRFGIKHEIIDIDILSFQQVMENSPERCYHCKRILLERIISTASNHGACAVLEGSHCGDMGDYRPGMRAISELGVVSPLIDAGFDKTKIYELSAYLDLPTSGRNPIRALPQGFPTGHR